MIMSLVIDVLHQLDATQYNFEMSPAMHRNCPLALEELLPYTPLLEGLGAEALSRLARWASEVRLSRDDRLFEAGSCCDGFHLVIQGQLNLIQLGLCTAIEWHWREAECDRLR